MYDYLPLSLIFFLILFLPFPFISAVTQPSQTICYSQTWLVLSYPCLSSLFPQWANLFSPPTFPITVCPQRHYSHVTSTSTVFHILWVRSNPFPLSSRAFNFFPQISYLVYHFPYYVKIVSVF